MGLIYFLSFFTLIAAIALIWAVIKLYKSSDQQIA